MSLLRFLAVTGLLIVGAVQALADTTFTYTLADDKATITGFVAPPTPIPSGVLTIPGTVDGYTVVAISPNAFEGRTTLTGVAFTANASFATIGAQAFKGCTGITKVTLPDAVTTVGAGAFADCDLLASITIGKAVATLGDGFVAGCPALTSITVASGNTSFVTTAGVLFNAARTTLLRAPTNLAGEYTVPSTVTTIATDAFAGNSALLSVVLPSGLTQISDRAFARATSLTFVNFPASLTTLGASAFNGASALISATFAGNAPTAGAACFDGTATGFKIYYSPTATGFTSPTWMGYSTTAPVLAVPTVVTGSVTAARVSATVSGSVPSANGSDVVARGFVYDKAGDPSLSAGIVVTVGSGTGFYSTALTSLSAGTTYHVRAYATNGEGTAYGAKLTFKTLATPTPAVIDRGIATTNRTPTLAGTAAAGATVSITIDTAAAVTVTADANGAWYYTVPSTGALAAGLHTIVITTTNSDGASVVETLTQSIIAPTGYAASASGGSAGTSVVVTTPEKFIEYATSANPYVINVSGLLDVGTVAVASNKTIQGVDANSGLDGCLNLSVVSNVIIRGLNLANSDPAPAEGIALKVANTQLVFVTHCTFLDSRVAQVEVLFSDMLTFSWCEFMADNPGQVAMKLGRESITDTPRITLHNNWWSSNLASGLPAAASGYVHQFSNYVNTPNNTAGTALSGAAQLLSEGNHFQGVANPITKAGTAVVRILNNKYDSCTGTIAAGEDAVFTPGYSYDMQKVADLADVATGIPALAGNQLGGGYDDPDIGSATITLDPNSTSVEVGKSVTLKAVPKDVTAGTYQWRRGNVAISGATNETYTISSMSSDANGVYTVAIGLADGSTVVSVPVQLTASTPSNNGGGGGGACGLLAPAVFVLFALRRRRA